MAEKTENHDRRIDYVEFNVADIAAAKAFTARPSAGVSPITARTIANSTMAG